jgi:hypothetical protein
VRHPASQHPADAALLVGRAPGVPLVQGIGAGHHRVEQLVRVLRHVVGVTAQVLDVFFICLSLWLLSGVVAPSRPPTLLNLSGLPALVALGLAMGALSLTRENALVLVIIVAAWILFASAAALTDRLRLLAAFAIAVAVVLVPVAIRNYAVGGAFYLTTSQFGPNFYIGNNPGADGTYASLRFGRGAPEYERQDATELAELASGADLFVCECYMFEMVVRAHLSLSTLREKLPLIGAKRVILTHMSDDMLGRLGDVGCEVAADGASVDF